jgi:hypothetical protein
VVADVVASDREGFEDARCDSLLLEQEPEEEVLSTDVVVL